VDRTALAARIQDILKGRNGGQGRPSMPAAQTPGAPIVRPEGAFAAPGPQLIDEEAAFAARCTAAEASARVTEVLGGSVIQAGNGSCLAIDREFESSHQHGRSELGRYVTGVSESASALDVFLAREGAAAGAGRALPGLDGGGTPRLLFFDTETTGLSGGAGTTAFLVGFAYFDGDAFRTRQFFMRSYAEERAMLDAVTAYIAGIEAESGASPILVTYNGRSFDVPLMDTRFSLHRRRSPFPELSHLDMLYPARRLWKRRAEGPLTKAAVAASRNVYQMSPDEAPGSCALTAIERDILSLHRHDDVPGWEIPTRYFAFARTGDASGLAGVLEHNRLDLISLAAVTALVLEMVRDGAASARSRRDGLALGRLFEYLERTDDAARCYAFAAEAEGMFGAEADDDARAEALKWLALHHRRARRFQQAADAWRAIAELPDVDVVVRREALEALAIHHEHRARDFESAREFAAKALELADDAKRVDEVRHRLGRLSRKIGGEPREPGLRWSERRGNMPDDVS
jgi:uncharacterized protein